MRASPADYKSALRRGQALLLVGAYLPKGRALARSLSIRRPRRSRSRGTELAVNYWFSLRICFWGDAHAGVSCRLQVGAPLKSELRFI